MKDARTNNLLFSLQQQLEALRAMKPGEKPPVLRLQRSEIEYCRDTWEHGVLRGEHRLYDIASLICRRLTGTQDIQHVARVVMGHKEEDETAGTVGSTRIVIEEHITRENLKRFTDFTLASRIARRYRYRSSHDQPFSVLYPRASFLELWPTSIVEDAPTSRVLTRVKTNDQIWNKVCDALFAIDSLLVRDKLLNTHSKYVKDVFGIKILTPRKADSYRVDHMLDNVVWSMGELGDAGLPFDGGFEKLELIERKDYLSVPPEQKKRTGWEAIKNVYRWGQNLFEVQIQTEANYFLEAMHLTDVSHRTFEMQRRQMRRDLELIVPHYAEFRVLLKLLFRRDDDELGELEQSLVWLEID